MADAFLRLPATGERGWTRRHGYSSHSLRFAVKRSLESRQQFSPVDKQGGRG